MWTSEKLDKNVISDQKEVCWFTLDFSFDVCLVPRQWFLLFHTVWRRNSTCFPKNVWYICRSPVIWRCRLPEISVFNSQTALCDNASHQIWGRHLQMTGEVDVSKWERKLWTLIWISIKLLPGWRNYSDISWPIQFFSDWKSTKLWTNSYYEDTTIPKMRTSQTTFDEWVKMGWCLFIKKN